ncbi:MAG: M28 family metallopeptidase [Opitutaceae bacterium]|nr:M28 family metallopeptidase [Opitutaceae bacterium]
MTFHPALGACTRLLDSAFVAAVALLPAFLAADDLAPALASFSADRIRTHIAVLASDEFEGRAPATPGEEKTVAYLAAELKQIGLQPGNPDGTWFQSVPMVGLTSSITTSINVGGHTLDLVPVSDYVALSRRVTGRVDVKDSPVVFVGYGVDAPEYHWDDYKGVDLHGKTVIMLINDPPVPDPRNPSRIDDTVFKGRAMTYYGRWTYKYEIASARGAAACLIIHETGPAGYPFSVVGAGWGREDFDLRTPDGNAGRVALEGWLTLDMAKRLFAAAGQDFAALKASAVRRDFQPVPLKAKASFSVQNQVRQVVSRNVVGLLPGSDPGLKNEFVIYSTHWDHLGRNPRLKGDQIFHGAADNASGCAVLMEIARALRALPVAPKRSILFAFVTAEEKGLLGSRYYAEHPLYPLVRTLANLNLDAVNLRGLTSEVEIIGHGNSTIEDIGAAVAQAEGRQVIPDTNVEKGYFYRSDHFEFAKAGVPAFYPKAGKTYLGRPAGWGRQQEDLYTVNDYHQVTDVAKSDWVYEGAIQDGAYLLKVGYAIAQGDRRPEWKSGSEFKDRHDAMMRQ